MNKLEHLKSLGFEKVREYKNSKIIWELLPDSDSYNSCLYAIVVKNDVKYIGYTSQNINQRLNNKHTKIEKLLESDKENIDIYCSTFCEPSFGQYYLDIAAGLEYCLIEIFKPELNIDGNKLKTSKEKRGREEEN